MSYSLLVDKDVSILLRDGETVVADVFRPAEAGTFRRSSRSGRIRRTFISVRGIRWPGIDGDVTADTDFPAQTPEQQIIGSSGSGVGDVRA